MEKLIETIQKRVNELVNDKQVQAHLLSLNLSNEDTHDYVLKIALATLMIAQEDRTK
jgi:hypothetical protein